MIKANKKVGIVYCGNSEKYVDELKRNIFEKKREGYCIETIVVDNKLINPERMIDERVFNNLDKCDYGIVFLTKDLTMKDGKSVSRPNVLLELGYLRGHLGKNKIWCITDFPHKDIEEKEYLLPSDFVAEVPEEIDKNNYKSGLKRVVEKFISTHNIVKLDNYDANDLVSSLILNPYYRTDFEELFSKDKLMQINKFSLQCQQEEIFEMWIDEKDKLEDAGQIIYLFERMVFLPFFPKKIIYDKLLDFLSVKIWEDNEYLYACRKILKVVNEYEECKRNKQKYESASFYLNKACEIEQELRIFESVKVAPIIECVTRNYLGLCYLNAYLASVKIVKEGKDIVDKEENILEKEYEEHLEACKTEANFRTVIMLSEKNFSDKVEVFQAFAEYNMARTIKNLREDAESEYNTAINKRRLLSGASSLPEIFKLNFSLERIHAEIDYYEKIESLSKELENIRLTPAADVSLFKSLEDKLNRCKNSSF